MFRLGKLDELYPFLYLGMLALQNGGGITLAVKRAPGKVVLYAELPYLFASEGQAIESLLKLYKTAPVVAVKFPISSTNPLVKK